ncbi:urea ABC transporter permease subunit UrtB [Methylobacter sp. S3L5C]|uniref:urea ABC transporter permease subunit UrtB n=1 Tax=Methylobacter sp. S3L5C TaxID=2839024 RepID=UPI001FAD06F8|nr:urea ABC transporter permease subunit UrtB [Methylobacter sp. S3L5C]UOA10083.1 urea ABC transporter permease subunit UrtB [Methylobacter sp. S3L5C]
MFGYTMDEVGNIMVMQGFSGLSLFSVLLLMALGLAIIFGQMGVINMAHGEFMMVGAYTAVFMSKLAVKYEMVNSYFVFAIIAAFILAFFIGYLVEYLLIRHLYKRPLDTLLATWGLSLVMQQTFRSSFGAKEVSAELPEWLLGSFQPTADIDIPINGVFVMVLALVVTLGVYFFMFRSRGGLRVRATVQNRVMASAVGINTQKVDRLTFALGCGIAGVAGAAFTTISSTGPTTGSLYIVDSFMVVVFGGAASLMGTIASAFGIAQAQSILQFFMTSSMGKVATLMTIVIILMMRPEGLFASKVRR